MYYDRINGDFGAPGVPMFAMAASPMASPEAAVFKTQKTQTFAPPTIRKEFPESWIWESLNETGLVVSNKLSWVFFYVGSTFCPHDR